MTDIQTRLIADPTQASRGIDAVNRKLDEMERKLRRVTAAGKDTQKALTAGTVARAGSRVGGVAGSALGRIGGAMSMDGTLGKIAVVAAAVGVAFTALNAVIQRRVQSEREVIQIQRQMAQIGMNAQRSRMATGNAGLSQEGAVRALVGRGGSVAQAEDLAKRFGVEFDDAAKGMAEALLARGGVQDALMEAAGRGVQSGNFGSLSDAVGALRGDRRAMGLIASGQGDDALAAVINKRNKLTGEARMTGDTIAQSLRLTGRDGFLRQTDAANEQGVRLSAAQRGAVTSGEATEGVRQQVIEALSPAAVAMGRFGRELHDATQELRRLSAAAGAFGEFMANARAVFGGEGSFEQQALRRSVAAGRALGGGD